MANFNHDYIGNLVMRAQADDSDAFAELYALTYQHIYNYAGHYLRDPFLAQDAMQETYVSALKNIRKIKEPTLFVAWLNQICFHVCYDMRKRDDSGYDTISGELLEILKDEHIYHDPVTSYEDKERAEADSKNMTYVLFILDAVLVGAIYFLNSYGRFA